MQSTVPAFVAVADKLNQAALGAAQWDDALTLVATATGSRACQLIGFDDRSAQFNLIGGLEAGVTAEIERLGGMDPLVNPRLVAGLARPVLQLITDADVITARDRRRHPFFNDIASKLDLPYIGAATLVRDASMNVGLAALRSESQGELDTAAREQFSQMALHVRSAVRIQALLGNKGPELLAGAMDALGIAVFICDRHGAVKALSPQAETMVGPGGPLTLRAGLVRSRCQQESDQLAAAIAAAAGQAATQGSVVLGSDSDDAPARWLEIVALPRLRSEFTFEPRVLVVVRGHDQANANISSALLQSRYRLTAAEAEVALQLADGLTLLAIAEQRGRSRETVRFQAKAIYSKLGVRGQPELAALLARWTAPGEFRTPSLTATLRRQQ